MPFDLLLGAAITVPALAAAAAGYAARARGKSVEALELDAHRVWALTGELLCEMTLEGEITRVADAFTRDLSHEAADLLGKRLVDLAHPDDAGRMLGALNPLAHAGGVRTFDARLRAANGEWRPLRWRATVDPAAATIHAAARPPGNPGHREVAANSFDLVFAASPIGMAVADVTGRIVRVNAPLCEIVGLPEDRLADRPLEDLLHPEDLDDAREQLARLTGGELGAVSLRLRLLGDEEREVPVTLAVSLVRDAIGEPLEYVVQIQDASEHERLQARVRFESDHDPLTGLLNRKAFSSVLGHHAAYSHRYSRSGALVILDIDGLRDVNEAYGPSVGDAVLQSFARSLRERLRETDVVARIGGDEFAIMLPEIDEIGAQRITSELVAAACRRALRVTGANEPLTISVSAGVELFGEETVSGEEIFTHADLALVEAKESGPGLWVVYDGGVRDRRRERNSRRTWADKLRAGLEHDAFLLDAQPIVDVNTGEAVQYELLLRLRDDDGSVVRPNSFMHIAERYGLMRSIDEWVARQAIELARTRLQRGAPITLAINLSNESVTDPAFVPLLVAELMDSADVGQHLVFEITERDVLGDIEQARRFIARLSEFGCRFALDDFGTGSGSFAHLKHLPVDYVKLDGEFTRGLPGDPIDREIVSAVVGAARALGKQVVAEAVEDAAILDAVRSFGIELAQGLHMGRPARASDLLEVGGTEIASAT